MIVADVGVRLGSRPSAGAFPIDDEAKLGAPGRAAAEGEPVARAARRLLVRAVSTASVWTGPSWHSYVGPAVSSTSGWVAHRSGTGRTSTQPSASTSATVVSRTWTRTVGTLRGSTPSGGGNSSETKSGVAAGCSRQTPVHPFSPPPPPDATTAELSSPCRYHSVRSAAAVAASGGSVEAPFGNSRRSRGRWLLALTRAATSSGGDCSVTDATVGPCGGADTPPGRTAHWTTTPCGGTYAHATPRSRHRADAHGAHVASCWGSGAAQSPAANEKVALGPDGAPGGTHAVPAPRCSQSVHDAGLASHTISAVSATGAAASMTPSTAYGTAPCFSSDASSFFSVFSPSSKDSDQSFRAISRVAYSALFSASFFWASFKSQPSLPIGSGRSSSGGGPPRAAAPPPPPAGIGRRRRR